MLAEQLQRIKSRVKELEAQLADPEFFKDRQRSQSSSKELARLKPLVESYGELERISKELGETEALLKSKTQDDELLNLYREEREQLLKRRRELETSLEEKLLEGTDPNQDKNIIIEIRAGTGGEEAALFARDLFRMYSRYCTEHGLTVDVMNTNATGK